MRRKGLIKRSVALVLAGVLMFNVAPMNAFAEEVYEVGDTITKTEKVAPDVVVENAVWVYNEEASNECTKNEHKHENACYTVPNMLKCAHHYESLLLGHPEECAVIDYNDQCKSFTCTKPHKYTGITTRYHLIFSCTHTHSLECYTLGCDFAIIGEHEHDENCFKYVYELKADINNNGVADEVDTYYTIKYVNGETVLQEDTILVGMSYPGYEGEEPTKTADAQYTYEFSGWDKAVADTVTEDVTHTAQFDKTVNEYTVTWYNHDGSDVLEMDENVPYGTKVSYDGEVPTKTAAEGENVVYTFVGWDPEVTEATVVKGDMEFSPVFSEKDVFEVKFNVEGASATKYVVDGEKAEVYAPTKMYYTLDGWYTSPNCADDTKFDFETPITGAKVLFAEWVPVNDKNNDGIADEEQACGVTVIGDVKDVEVSGNKIPGQTITISAKPIDGKFITGVIKVNGTVYETEVTFNKTKATFEYALPTGEAADYTFEVQTADATVSLYSEYVNWNSLMTAEEAEESVFENVNFGEMPATVAENTEVKYLEHNVIVKSWKDIGATDITPFLGHKFGEKTEETVLLTFAGGDQVPGFTKEFKVKLKDDRLASKIEANDVILTYSPSVTKAEMEKAIFDAAFVAATSEDGTVALEAVYGENVFVENANVNAGTHTVTIEFSGTSEYAASSTEVTVTVKKAASYTNVSDANVKYGTEVNASALIDTGVAERVEFVAGLSMGEDASTDAKTIVYVNMPELVDTDNLPDWAKSFVDGLLSDLKEGTELSISDLNKYLTGILERFEDLGNIPGLNIDADAVSSLISVLKNLENIDGVGDIKIKLSFDGTLKLTDAGMYIVGAVVSDANYNPSFGANYVVITPDGYKAELGWNEEDKNGIITRNAIVNNTFDFGASVTKVYEGTIEEAEKHITTFFMGVDANGEATVTYDPAELKFGVYTQIAMLTNVGNTMYYAEPIQRVFTVVPQITEVEVVNSEVVYNGESHKVNVNVNGSAYEGEGLTVTYVGVDTNGNVYNSTQAPVNTGVYTVYATYATKVDGIYEYAGFDAGVLVIKPATATLVVEDTYVDYDGNPHMPTIKNENSLELIKVIVDENNNVNVVFPFEVETKTVNVAEATAELKAVLTATGKGYATAEAISNKLVAELNKVDLEKLTVMGADELAAFIAELKEEAVKASETLAKYDVDTVTAELVKLLNKVKVNEFTVNGTLPTEDGVYEVTAIGFGANYKPALATGTLNIHKHIPAAAVKENNVDPDCENPGSYDEVVYCDNDNCGKVNNELSRVTVPVEKLGHDWADWVTTKKPTTSSKGEQRRDCNRCDDFETRPLDKLPAAGGSGNDSSNDKGTELEGVYEAPTAPTAPAATATAGASTGDSANILGYVSLFVAAGAAMVLIFFKKKRA